jgi:ABC-type oligopeptide transport system ATPase subunit
VDAVLDKPSEDYTKALIAAIPVPDPGRRQKP